eukprot:4432367-Prymnesium_polylepis.1
MLSWWDTVGWSATGRSIVRDSIVGDASFPDANMTASVGGADEVRGDGGTGLDCGGADELRCECLS